MLRNRGLKFVCADVHVRVERSDTPFTLLSAPGRVLRLPIAHGEGNYYAPPEVLARLEQNGQVVYRYVSPGGEPVEAANPNGSQNGIAGICNEARNVVGLMPHPERACEPMLGSADGRVFFESAVAAVTGRAAAFI
jgi:phosphoribosylformylglycinamidine synthase